MIISVKARNFKKHKLLNLDNINGRTFFLVGDTETGKSSVLSIIKSSLMLEDFPDDPVSDGESSGEFEVVHELDGVKYTVKRTFTKDKDKKSRFTVVDQNGGRHTLSDLLERIFGKAFVNSHFDYAEYFYKQKSSEARTAYFIKAIGGDDVLKNKELQKKKTRERGAIGGQRTTYLSLIDNSSLNPDTLEKDLEYYKEEKTFTEADEKKDEILATRKSVTNLNNQLNIVRNANEQYQISSDKCISIENEIAGLETQIKLLRMQKDAIAQVMLQNPNDPAREAELIEEIKTVDENNLKIETLAMETYNDLVLGVNTHNNMRRELNNAVGYYDKWKELDAEWKSIDSEITDLDEANKKILAEKVPIPGITLEEVDGQTIVMYQGREMKLEGNNVSTGRSIRLAIEIQRALNPKGNNLVVIPEAQSLGSQLDEILEECKNMGIQAVIEVTERKQPFEIRFEEDFLK